MYISPINIIKGLHNILDVNKQQINKVINLEIDDEAIVDRISGRLVCKCGETYHRTY